LVVYFDETTLTIVSWDRK